MVGTDWIEMYNKCRLRDLGFQGMNAYQQAEKVLQEYAEGKRGIIAFYAECHRVMLIERKIWRPNKGILQEMMAVDIPATLIDAAKRLETNIEEELQKSQKENKARAARKLRGRRGWKR